MRMQDMAYDFESFILVISWTTKEEKKKRRKKEKI